MGSFTIKFGNTKHTFTTQLSNAKAAMFSHWGTNLKNCIITANSITVSNKNDFDFVKQAFIDLAKRDGHEDDITDKDFEGIKDESETCARPNIIQNVWHSDDTGEYNYHTKKTNGPSVDKSIWLSNHEEDGV